jgi:hypothetical protein
VSPNSAPGSAGQVTISVSTKPPISVKLGTSVQGAVLSRGLEEPGQPESGSQAPSPTETTDPGGEVAERGIPSLQMAKKSAGVQTQIITPPSAASPTVTLPPSQLGAAATQVKPGTQIGSVGAAALSLPSETKSAVLSVQLPLGMPLPSK